MTEKDLAIANKLADYYGSLTLHKFDTDMKIAMVIDANKALWAKTEMVELSYKIHQTIEHALKELRDAHAEDADPYWRDECEKALDWLKEQ